MEKQLRVLHAVGTMDAGGIETLLMSIYRNIDRNAVQFDFLYSIDKKCLFDDEILDLGGKIYRETLSRKHPMKARRKVGSVIQQGGYNILHQHVTSMPYLVPFGVACDLGLKRRIIHVHNANVHMDSFKSKALSNWGFRQVRGIGCRRSTNRLACSSAAAEWAGFNRPGVGWEYLPNGIDVERFRFDERDRAEVRGEFGIGAGALVIGTVGRLVHQKNHMLLVDAFSEVAALRPDAVLMLVGDGPLRADIELRAKRLGVSDRLVVSGQRADASRFYSAMDCFVFPSLDEGLGIALVEAQANGLPCVVSDGVPREALVGSRVVVCGLGQPPSRWAAQILESVSMGRDLGAYREVAQAGFDVCSVARRIEGIYLGDEGGWCDETEGWHPRCR